MVPVFHLTLRPESPRPVSYSGLIKILLEQRQGTDLSSDVSMGMRVFPSAFIWAHVARSLFQWS